MIGAVESTIVLPAASCTATVGWLAQTALEAPPPGCTVKPNFAGSPVAVNELLTALVSPVAVAVRV